MAGFFLFVFSVSGICGVLFHCFRLSVQLIALKCCVQNDLLCIEWGVQPNIVSRSLAESRAIPGIIFWQMLSLTSALPSHARCTTDASTYATIL